MNEKQLKSLIKEFVNTWDDASPEIKTGEASHDSIEKVVPMTPEQVAAVLNDAMGGRHASGRKMHPAFVKKN